MKIIHPRIATRLGVTAVATTALLAGGGALVWAQAGGIPGPDGVIHACYPTTAKYKNLLLIVPANGTTCPTGYTPLNFNQTGPQGPQGPQGSKATPATPAPPAPPDSRVRQERPARRVRQEPPVRPARRARPVSPATPTASRPPPAQSSFRCRPVPTWSTARQR